MSTAEEDGAKVRLSKEFQAWIARERGGQSPAYVAATTDGLTVFVGPVDACEKGPDGCGGALMQSWRRGALEPGKFLCHYHAQQTVERLNYLNRPKG